MHEDHAPGGPSAAEGAAIPRAPGRERDLGTADVGAEFNALLRHQFFGTTASELLAEMSPTYRAIAERFGDATEAREAALNPP